MYLLTILCLQLFLMLLYFNFYAKIKSDLGTTVLYSVFIYIFTITSRIYTFILMTSLLCWVFQYMKSLIILSVFCIFYQTKAVHFLSVYLSILFSSEWL